MFRLLGKLILLLLALVSAGVVWQKNSLTILALERVDPLPETKELIAAGHYAEANEYLGFFMEFDYVAQDPEARALLEDIESHRSSYAYQASKLAEGLFTGSSDETIGQAASVTSDFFLFGDLRDLSQQGWHWVKGEPVDKAVTTLAGTGVAIGLGQLVAGAATIGTAGAAAPSIVATSSAKIGISMLKIARRMGKQPPWLGKALVRSAGKARIAGNMAAIRGLFGDLAVLAKTRGGIELLSHTRDAVSLHGMASFAKALGKDSLPIFMLGGKMAIKATGNIDRLGKESIRVAATYGQKGLKLLNKTGMPSKFKLASRLGKMGIKGDILKLLAHILANIPVWILYGLIALGVIIWKPWRWADFILRPLSGKLARRLNETRAVRH
ncbi:hypothetical protein C7446_0390 [Kushneria sinocarnis]|uniref:Uncharacterized protein n=1 Tax=Kushneria sinocarnis TaxID=595502 RepID=A0A420X1F6_9GAMM|nr:hypothetical protein [Kushneria sinocarnis]RKR07577.1 hypothetical protein C7446_0390 [Kushneria sinocarnis]